MDPREAVAVPATENYEFIIARSHNKRDPDASGAKVLAESFLLQDKGVLDQRWLSLEEVEPGQVIR